MLKIEVLKCWYNVYSENIALDLVLIAPRIRPITFSIEVPESILAVLKCTPLFTKGITASDELAGDWTGQTWQITLNTIT